MASELKLDMRGDGFVRVKDLLLLNLMTYAKVPLRSHTIEEIIEVSSLLPHNVNVNVINSSCIICFSFDFRYIVYVYEYFY